MVCKFKDQNEESIDAFRPKAVIDITASSTSSAFPYNCLIRIVADSVGYFEVSPNPNDSTKVYIPANQPEIFRINKNDKIKATTANLNVTILE